MRTVKNNSIVFGLGNWVSGGAICKMEKTMGKTAGLGGVHTKCCLGTYKAVMPIQPVSRNVKQSVDCTYLAFKREIQPGAHSMRCVGPIYTLVLFDFVALDLHEPKYIFSGH